MIQFTNIQVALIALVLTIFAGIWYDSYRKNRTQLGRLTVSSFYGSTVGAFFGGVAIGTGLIVASLALWAFTAYHGYKLKS